MISLPLLGVAVLLAKGPESVAADDRPGTLQLAPNSRVGAREAAEQFVRHLYTVYLGIRGCAEASAQFAKPEYLTTVSLEDARRTMKIVDAAARDVGIDIDRIWSEAAPLGSVTAEALKTDTPANAERCRQLGGVFRIDLSNLQNALAQLGSNRPIIEKDF